MSAQPHPIVQLLERDSRYKLEAYQFIREALAYAQDELGMARPAASDEEEPPPDAHLTGQQLCEAVRRLALEQFGLMARVVLNSWGIRSTGDFGEIVYNLIGIGMMKKSASDRREDFENVFDFEEAFEREFKITPPRKAS
ncbi:MAG: Minf_1886 family protein [Planctomycetota bacterium]